MASVVREKYTITFSELGDYLRSQEEGSAVGCAGRWDCCPVQRAATQKYVGRMGEGSWLEAYWAKASKPTLRLVKDESYRGYENGVWGKRVVMHRERRKAYNLEDSLGLFMEEIDASYEDGQEVTREQALAIWERVCWSVA